MSCPEQHPDWASLNISVQRIIEWIDRLLVDQGVVACTIGVLFASNLVSLLAWASLDSVTRFTGVFFNVLIGVGLVVFLRLRVGVLRNAADVSRLDDRSWTEGELNDLNRLLARIETASRVLGGILPAGIIGSPWLRLWLYSLIDEFSILSLLVVVAALIPMFAVLTYTSYGLPTPKDLRMEIQDLLRNHHGVPVILADR